MNLEGFAYIILASVTLFYGVFIQRDPRRSILSLAFSTLLWIATLIQNIYDEGISESGLWWLYLFPITICVMMIMHRGTVYLNRGFHYKEGSYKEDSWK